MFKPRTPRLTPRDDGSLSNEDELHLPPPLLHERDIFIPASPGGEITTPPSGLLASQNHGNEQEHILENATHEQHHRRVVDLSRRYKVSSETRDQLENKTIQELDVLEGLMKLSQDTWPAPQPTDDQQQPVSLESSAPSISPPTLPSISETRSPNYPPRLRRRLPTLEPDPSTGPSTVAKSLDHPSLFRRPSQTLSPSASIKPPTRSTPTPAPRAPKPIPGSRDQKLQYKPVITRQELLDRVTKKEVSTLKQKSLNELNLARETIQEGTAVQDRCMGCRLEGLPCFFRASSTAEEEPGRGQETAASDNKVAKQRCAGCAFRHVGGCERVADADLPEAEREHLRKRGEKRNKAAAAKRARQASDDEGKGEEGAKKPRLSVP